MFDPAWFLVILVAIVGCFFLFRPKSPPAHIRHASRPQRRLRLSGGFYPVGYDGEYLPGEDMVDYFIWGSVLDDMELEERLALGDYGVEDYEDENTVTGQSRMDSREDDFVPRETPLRYLADDPVVTPESISFEPASDPYTEVERRVADVEPHYVSHEDVASSYSTDDSDEDDD